MAENQVSLEMHGISKSFPGVQALKEVDLILHRGEILGLVGENGAGKSTLMNILTGILHSDTGIITLKGKPVNIENPRQAQIMGISIIHQELSVLPNLTVGQNVFLGREPRLPIHFLVDWKNLYYLAKEHFKKLNLDIDPHILLSELSVAQRQMVEVARALSFKADIVVMDEPTSTLTEMEVKNLFSLIHTLKEQGISIVFISHRLEEIFRIVDRVIVLRDGVLVGSAPISQVDPKQLVMMMVGRELKEMFPKESLPQKEKVLSVKNLKRGKDLKGVSFDLHRGEILGLAGLVGSGRTFVARAIFGADPLEEGEIWIEGKKVQIRSPQEAISYGISFLPEDRKAQGLFLKLPLSSNIAITDMKELSFLGIIIFKKLQELASSFVNKLKIRTPSIFQIVRNLSGGTQQKVVLAKWLALKPKVLILDEPTVGIDVATKAEIHALMNGLAKEGVAILMISSELPEVLGVSDRILVMHEGLISGEFLRQDATQDKIMLCATGGANNG
ncbi:sugar ABC transporter ATP-binding protein [Candidatus Cryosericum septentrionale]|jgi:ribose transport system ATP-binding protein|uniref:Sugar ABC transporter ATP-binding protein n=1 Tax=Candidatus Cryosericum septentrionale TaxID=2290913 RepID=A0A398DJ80_9BACT|nr:sugar ABC transporter ATP-binding protein [Candidatus Cryosericum septentrionale]RIE15622.1 sugar ABC transporter ATP-binding protein [Candidatus Cryosericum septentrionale]